MKLLLYAKAKEIFNSNVIIYNFNDSTSLYDVMTILCDNYSLNDNNKNYILNICKYAIDNKFIDSKIMIDNDITIKIIPPISSG